MWDGMLKYTGAVCRDAPQPGVTEVGHLTYPAVGVPGAPGGGHLSLLRVTSDPSAALTMASVSFFFFFKLYKPL